MYIDETMRRTISMKRSRLKVEIRYSNEEFNFPNVDSRETKRSRTLQLYVVYRY